MAGSTISVGSPQHTWTARPGAARAVRVFVAVAPPAASITTSFLISRRLPPAPDLVVVGLWWVFLAAVATAVLFAVDQLVRRLLPLSALLDLALSFPDVAPSRYAIAPRSGSVRTLTRRIERVRREGLGENPAEAARTVVRFLGALSHHDAATRGHVERVRAYSRLIGEEMGLDPAELDKLQWAGLVHDIGKLFVPREILNKPRSLTAEEYDVVKRHPEDGAKLIEPLAPWLGDWSRAVLEHHEKYDGTGYPAALSGMDISRGARIVAVADVYDVLTSSRSYKQPIDPGAARSELVACSGSHFDPDVVKAFLRTTVGRRRRVTGPLTWLAQLPFLPSAVSSAAAGTVTGAVGASALGATAVGISGAVLSAAALLGVVAAPEVAADPPSAVVADEADQGGLAPGTGPGVVGAPIESNRSPRAADAARQEVKPRGPKADAGDRGRSDDREPIAQPDPTENHGSTRAPGPAEPRETSQDGSGPAEPLVEERPGAPSDTGSPRTTAPGGGSGAGGSSPVPGPQREPPTTSSDAESAGEGADVPGQVPGAAGTGG